MSRSPSSRTAGRARVEIESRALDVLSEMLAVLRLRGEVICRSELSAPWGLSFDSDEAYFHVVERGQCLVQVLPGDETVEVSGGDLVLLPHGRGHRLLDAAGSGSVSLRSLIDPRRKRPTGVFRYGGGGAETDLVCGRVHLDAGLRMSTLFALPTILHVRGSRGRPPEWLALTLRLLAAEAKSDAPGRELAMSRLVDLLFVQTVRHWLTTSRDQPLGWIGALSDPRVGAALAHLHAHPERDWNVVSLAAEVGMSRSAFATRFVNLVGEPPNKYLTRLRVDLAAQLLRAPGATIARTAERVGYESEAAFSRVFKRYTGRAPAAFRQQYLNRLLGTPDPRTPRRRVRGAR